MGLQDRDYLRDTPPPPRRGGRPGGGLGLAVFGDVRLRRWRWLHLPLVAAAFAVALVRVAAAGYFAVEPPSAIVPQRSVP